MEPLVSIIVPIYKAERSIHRCLDSILNQSYTNYELILVDDGSPDNSGAICDNYADKDNRIKVIHKSNGGVSTARNTGIDHSCGKWIVFVDSDDYLGDGFLIDPSNFKEDLLIQNYEVFGFINNLHIFNKKIISETEIKHHIEGNVHKQIFRVPWSKYFKASIIKDNNIRYQTNVNIGEDTLFVLDYLQYTKSINYIASSMYMYESDSNHDRYGLPAKKALSFFHKFIESYKKLEIDSIPFLRLAFTIYWCLIKPNKSNKFASEWYNDAVVKDTYKIIRNHLPLTLRLSYDFFRILPSAVTICILKLVKLFVNTKNIRFK